MNNLYFLRVGCSVCYTVLVPMTFVHFSLFYLVENNHQKDKPDEVSSEQDSDTENIDRNLGDTTDILNMVIYCYNRSLIQ